jgi:hypothetical protein
MVTLEDTLKTTHDWAIDRLHTLCETETDDVLKLVEDAYSIQCEFAEWLDPNVKNHEIFSLEYLGED